MTRNHVASRGQWRSESQTLSTAISPSCGLPWYRPEIIGLWRKPLSFVSVGAGNKTEDKGKEKKTRLASGSCRVWSASGMCYSDVGDDHSLYDKDSG